MEDKNQVHGAAVPRQWGTHAGEDVPVYALGPLATTLFAGWYPVFIINFLKTNKLQKTTIITKQNFLSGTFDQSYIPHAIAYSACLGEHRLRCQGLDHYVPTSGQNCSHSEVSGNAVNGQPVAVASSVMADDGHRVVSSGCWRKEMFSDFVAVCIVSIKLFSIT